MRDNDDWLACIPDAHPGYISWEQHQENLTILKANGHGYDAARASIPREGPALLQGRAVCGQCGRLKRKGLWSPDAGALFLPVGAPSISDLPAVTAPAPAIWIELRLA